MNVKNVNVDEVIAQYPVRHRLELSSRARQVLRVLVDLRSAIGHIPTAIQEKLQPAEWNDPEKVAVAVGEIIKENPFKGYFSFRNDPVLPHPMINVVNQQSIAFINDQIWAVIFGDFNKELGMSSDVFNFITLSICGKPPSSCLVTGYELQEDQPMTDGSFEEFPTKDPESK
jgi:hypothetical protein